MGLLGAAEVFARFSRRGRPAGQGEFVGEVLHLRGQVVLADRADQHLVRLRPEGRVKARPERVVAVAKADVVSALSAVVAEDDGLRHRPRGPQPVVAVRQHRARRDFRCAALGDRRAAPGGKTQQARDIGAESRRGRGRDGRAGAVEGRNHNETGDSASRVVDLLISDRGWRRGGFQSRLDHGRDAAHRGLAGEVEPGQLVGRAIDCNREAAIGDRGPGRDLVCRRGERRAVDPRRNRERDLGVEIEVRPEHLRSGQRLVAAAPGLEAQRDRPARRDGRHDSGHHRVFDRSVGISCFDIGLARKRFRRRRPVAGDDDLRALSGRNGASQEGAPKLKRVIADRGRGPVGHLERIGNVSKLYPWRSVCP